MRIYIYIYIYTYINISAAVSTQALYICYIYVVPRDAEFAPQKKKKGCISRPPPKGVGGRG